MIGCDVVLGPVRAGHATGDLPLAPDQETEPPTAVPDSLLGIILEPQPEGALPTNQPNRKTMNPSLIARIHDTLVSFSYRSRQTARAAPCLSAFFLLASAAALQAGPSYAWTNFVGQPGGVGNVDGTGAAARFWYPQGVAVDGAGNVYVADLKNHTIRKMSAAGVVTTLAGSAGVSGSADGTGSAARFNSPAGVAVDGAGNVYVADGSNHTIRKVTAAGVVTTLAGSAGSSGSAVAHRDNGGGFDRDNLRGFEVVFRGGNGGFRFGSGRC